MVTKGGLYKWVLKIWYSGIRDWINEVIWESHCAVLSTLILSLAFIVAEQQAGVGYFSFKGIFIIYAIYSLPVYLIGGGLYSAFIDIYLKKIQFYYGFLKYIEFVLYIAGGLLKGRCRNVYMIQHIYTPDKLQISNRMLGKLLRDTLHSSRNLMNEVIL